MVDIDATSPQLKLVKAWVEGYHSLDINNVGPHLSENYKYQMLPKSTGEPDLTKESYLQRHGATFPALTKVEDEIQEVIEAPGKVIIHTIGRCHSIDGAAHNYETILIISIAEEGGKLKIVSIKDFTDSAVRGTAAIGIVKAMGLVNSAPTS